ncbi:WbqC family protein [Roseburia inulinivorans]
MRLGIMQPYFMPYLGYISLIKHTDQFILFDTAQFIRHGWIERNRILKPGGGWQYIAVPLIKHSQKTSICDIQINNKIEWKDKLFAQLIHYKKAPYYDNVMSLMKKVLAIDYTDIVTLNKESLIEICNYLGIKTPISVFSELNLNISEVKAADEWALNICKAIPGTTEYWNPPGGMEFFDTEKYRKNGIDICFQKMNLKKYYQGKNEFESGLSILDVMMYNEPQKINNMLDDFVLLK